jgi:hypothetical protein
MYARKKVRTPAELATATRHEDTLRGANQLASPRLARERTERINPQVVAMIFPKYLNLTGTFPDRKAVKEEAQLDN